VTWSSFNAGLKRGPGWLVLLFLAVLFLAVGISRDAGVSNPDERAAAIEQRLACPTCGGQSVYESRATGAVNISNEVQRLVDEGQLSDDEIISQLEAIYGEELLLLPRGDGINVLVWALPVAAAVAGVAGLVLVFRKWRRDAETASGPTDEDRELVAAALAAGLDDVPAADPDR
jgi:cytochrome c-type biogenesis protein CcmH